MFGRTPRTITEFAPTNDQFSRQAASPFVDAYPDSSSNVILHNKNFLSSNDLLNRILEKRNATRPLMNINSRNFYSNLDSMTIKWAQSLSQRMLNYFSIHKIYIKNSFQKINVWSSSLFFRLQFSF